MAGLHFSFLGVLEGCFQSMVPGRLLMSGVPKGRTTVTVRRIVNDGFGEHDLTHEHEYRKGDRVDATAYTEECGTILQVGHIQPAVENAGWNGKQNFSASCWYDVELDSGKVTTLNPERMRPI